MFSRSPRGSKSQLKLQCAFWHRCRLTRLPFLLNPNLYHAFALPMHSSSADYSTWLSLLPHIELALPLSFTANCLPLHFFPIKFRPQLQPSSRVILFFNDDSFWSLHHLPKCSTHLHKFSVLILCPSPSSTQLLPFLHPKPTVPQINHLRASNTMIGNESLKGG